MLPLILFYLFATILVLAAVAVIVSRNPVYSALSLVLCFVTSAAIWLLIEAEFLAHRAGAGLRRRRHGAVPVRGHDARHQPRGAARRLHALRLARLDHGRRRSCSRSSAWC